ncbi:MULTISPECIES: hypothetical protein [Kordiimonas]|uniref:hypothetical protein n=1 Tax=Kordiimonas TaxID=288021 RepID=UPI00257B4640|nr:hypothetical protein [Kordiimonas sp. UBA4487]
MLKSILLICMASFLSFAAVAEPTQQEVLADTYLKALSEADYEALDRLLDDDATVFDMLGAEVAASMDSIATPAKWKGKAFILEQIRQSEEAKTSETTESYESINGFSYGNVVVRENFVTYTTDHPEYVITGSSKVIHVITLKGEKILEHLIVADFKGLDETIQLIEKEGQ